MQIKAWELSFAVKSFPTAAVEGDYINTMKTTFLSFEC